MADLSQALREALADTFAFYFKAHAFHWNVTGPNFPELHGLFGSIYEDAHDAVDDLAEHIRTLGELAPASLDEIVSGSSIEDSSASLPASAMVAALRDDNELVVAALNVACAEAIKAGKAGLSNFLQDRIDKHAKWGWMLTATSG